MTTAVRDPVPAPATSATPVAGRGDVQVGRRLFHAVNGVAIASAYAVLFTHGQVVHLFGTIACLVYILDRIRVTYPEVVAYAPWINRVFFRAEEQFRESAMTPYAIAILLTILTMPKAAALIAIYTLALADPLSALVGIRWGRHRLAGGKSLEGSAAFFVATAVVAGTVLAWSGPAPPGPLVGAALLIAAAGTGLEALPLRLDDNLTIPLGVGFASWIACTWMGVAIA